MSEGLSSALARLAGAEGDLQEARLRLEVAQVGRVALLSWRSPTGRRLG